jgi:hypothetical protein
MTQRLLKRGEALCPKCGRPRYVIERCCDVYGAKNEPEQTFWNYEPTPARKVRVIVGKSLRPTWWCAELAGQERAAVEVNYYGEKFYLDDEDGSGWNKVTRGRGGPDWGHSSLPDDSVPVAEPA